MFQRLLSLFDRTITEPPRPLVQPITLSHEFGRTVFAIHNPPAQTSPDLLSLGADPMQATYDKYQGLILADLSKKQGMEEVGLNPIIITILGQIIPALISALMSGCGPTPVPVPPAKAKAKANNPNFLDRASIRFKLVEAAPGFDLETIKLRGHLFDSILAAGKQVTEEDVTPIAA